MTRLAFTADLHVDSYFSRIDPTTGLNAREVDFLRTTEWVATKAREFGGDALVVAGDYTESKVPARGPRIARIARALAHGPERQIHLEGNHDSRQAGDSIVTVLGSMPGWSGYSAPGFELVGDTAICAIPFLDRRTARTIPELAEVPDADLFRLLGEQYLTIARGLFVAAESVGAKSAILTGHQQLAGAQMTDTQRAFLGDVDLVVDARALAAIGYAAVIFGHVHRAQAVIDGDHSTSPVFFAGSVERVDFAEELEAKSFLMVDVEPGRTVQIDAIPTPARPYLTIRGDGSFNPAAVEDSVVRAIELDPDVDVDELRRALEASGAFAVTNVRRRREERPDTDASVIASAGGPDEILAAYLEGDPDAESLIERGRAVLAEVGS